MTTVKTTINPEDWINHQLGYVTGTAAAGSANVTNVTLALKDLLGRAPRNVKSVLIYLSDSSAGVGLTATSASGTVVAGASGVDLGDLTTKKAKMVQFTAAGVYVLQITDTAKTGFFVCVDLLNGHPPLVAFALSSANYG